MTFVTPSGYEATANLAPPVSSGPAWQGRSIGTSKLRLVEFSAFLEQPRDADTVSGTAFSTTSKLRLGASSERKIFL